MNRKKKALVHIDPQARGLEIGPSYNPLAPKKEGFRVQIMDHLDREGLKRKYQELGVDVDPIEEVDFIWKGQPLRELVGDLRYDWIIASHVIEHSTDLIGFLLQCEEILKPDGVLSLVIPDHRFCFDYFRPPTGLARIIDAHHSRSSTHSIGTAAEFFLNIVTLDGRSTWEEGDGGNFAFYNEFAEGRRKVEDYRRHEGYTDLHAWCFTPSSFRLLLSDLRGLGYLQLAEQTFFDTSGCEFFLTLSRQGGGPPLGRMDLLKQMRKELAWNAEPGGGLRRLGCTALAVLKGALRPAWRTLRRWTTKRPAGKP